MARNDEFASLTKEPPVEKLDATLDLLKPGITYKEWLRLAETEPAHPAAPGLLRKRFLSVGPDDRIEYDGLFALLMSYGPRDARVRKIMYLIWAMRDERIRRFILERIVNPDTGRWDPERLKDKENWKFFYKPGGSQLSAKKARSNYERYLEKVGIYVPATESFNLSLDDGWLTDAMAILAAGEPDIETRERMVRDPVSFLASEGLSALVDLPDTGSVEHYRGELENWEPLDDRRLPDVEEGEDGGRDWRPRDLARFQHRSAPRLLSLVALERATEAHHTLEQIAAAAIERAGFIPRQTSAIDMYFDQAHRTAILEMKSCNTGNIHSQVRKAVSQLLEYRWRYRPGTISSVDLAVVLETAPGGAKRWLVEYLASIGICCAWKDAGGETLVTSSEIPPLLAGIVFPARE
jgi:hypothetical protein